jgi:uncharacterized phage protein (predicted DNA packaging)
MLNGVKITDLGLDLVKEYLRIDHEDDDILLTTMLVAAKSYIQSYLNQKFTDFAEIPDEFTIACLALVSHWYEKREIQTEKASKEELVYVFAGLLDLHRNWNNETTPTE